MFINFCSDQPRELPQAATADYCNPLTVIFQSSTLCRDSHTKQKLPGIEPRSSVHLAVKQIMVTQIAPPLEIQQ